MSKNIKLDGIERIGVSTLRAPLADGSGMAVFQDIDEASSASGGQIIPLLEGTITEFTVPVDANNLRDGLFYGCKLLEKIEVEEGNTAYKSLDGVLYSKDGSVLVAYPVGKAAREFIMPDTVTEIKPEAFIGCNENLIILLELSNEKLSTGGIYPYSSDAITGIIIPEDATYFDCDTLTNLPNVKTIYYNAINCDFEGGIVSDSKSGTYINPPLGNNVVIDKVIFGDKVQVIPECLCYNSNISSVSIGDSVTTIGDGVFYGSLQLSSIEVSSENTAYKSLDGVLYSKDGSVLVAYPAGKAGDFIVPSTVEIRPFAFSPAASNQSIIVTLNSELLNAGGAYTISFSPNTVIIPEDTTYLDYNAFSNMTYVTAVYYNPANCDVELYSYSDSKSGDVIYSALHDMGRLNKIIFGNTVEHIPDGICSSLYYLSSVITEGDIKTIGEKAFYKSYNITDFTFGDNITDIGDYAFYNCYNLTTPELNLPNIVSIGINAFYNCKFTNISLGANLTNLGSGAFYNCYNLTSVTILSTTATIDSTAFLGCPSTMEIHGYTGSTAETFATNNGYTFVAITE